MEAFLADTKVMTRRCLFVFSIGFSFLNWGCSQNAVSTSGQLTNVTKKQFRLSDDWCRDEGIDSCFGLHFKLSSHIEDFLLSTLMETDANKLIRQVLIDIHDHSHATEYRIASPSSAGHILDDFLTPRPWWIVVKESLVQRHKHQNHSLSGSIYHLFLHRQWHKLEPQLNQISKMQYPPSSECRDTKLVVGHMVNSGWGSHMNFFGDYWGDNRNIIFNIWDSQTNKVNEGVAYATSSLCPTIINKRLCAFLPITNCSMPTAITSSTPAKVFVDSLVAFTSASEDGLPVMYNNVDGNIPKTPYQTTIDKLYERTGRQGFRASRFIDGNGKELGDAHDGSQMSPPTRQVLRSHGIIFRPNALYRWLISQRVAKFREEEQFAETLECVAIHIRRGDRTHAHTDMVAYCKNFTLHSPTSCTSKSGEAHDCQDLQDVGCFSLNPFGALRLQQYLDKAWQLHPTHNVFVVTDDEPWLMQEKRLLAGAEWRVAAIAARPGDTRRHDSPHATEHGVDFLASVAVARQCQAFVGHWGSAVSHLLFNAMCMQHGAHVGTCPKACDMGADFTKG